MKVHIRFSMKLPKARKILDSVPNNCFVFSLSAYSQDRHLATIKQAMANIEPRLRRNRS